MQRVDGTDENKAVDIAEEDIYTIEVAANRYDLLCLEGISAALRCFLGLGEIPSVKIV